MKKRIAVVIPAKNEEKGIGRVIDGLPKPFISEVVILDGNSTDKTCAIAKKKGARVFKSFGKGKGTDFAHFLEANHFKSDIYVMLDGDGSYDPRNVKDLAAPILRGDADVVMGYRFNGRENTMQKGAMSRVNLFGNKCLTYSAKLLYNRHDLKDICTGYWAFSKEFLKKARIEAKCFDLEANLFTEAVRTKMRIAHIPVTYHRRLGVGKLTMIHGFKIQRWLIRERFR